MAIRSPQEIPRANAEPELFASSGFTAGFSYPFPRASLSLAPASSALGRGFRVLFLMALGGIFCNRPKVVFTGEDGGSACPGQDLGQRVV